MSISLIDWKSLLESQRNLDSFIFKNKSLSYEDTTNERILALVVELNELANTAKSFKFWSVKEGNKKEMLEEYVDVLHFILSICIEKNIDVSDINFSEDKFLNKKELTEKFIYLNKTFDFSVGKEQFKKWIIDFLSLGSNLGFNWQQIEEAYFYKLNVNKKRQNNNY